ncbi:DUF317 domain-containing protein [Streptomyces iranensis]|uniref:DUF317 domain-containing protein n=1 Tax=Streptomyces iranensis TaxID=576784 RepID=A0A060ZW06_9ACTN|nr:DUF317 domain-containing protein [Streptomyces iranensis]MBP2059584.1 hypothetical protein [Streptomyces iranensis]CDR10506.1 predicted protein [Streptomyces iranensis]
MTSNAPTLAHPASAEREWLLECTCADPVLRLLHNCGWDTVDDSKANVYCASPDRRVFVEFLPESPEAAFGELWHISVHGPDGRRAWSTTFGDDVPAHAVAGFLAALIAYQGRWCECI